MTRLINRREFLKSSTAGAAAAMASSARLAPIVSGSPQEALFRLYPHPQTPDIGFVYAADEFEDPFKSSMHVTNAGIVIPADFGDRKFSVNARWYVEGFGYVWLSADNGGALYSLRQRQERGSLNLNYEFARSRVTRNRNVVRRYESDGTAFSGEVRRLAALSEELLEEASKKMKDGERAALVADKALNWALWAGEKIELEKARSDIARMSVPAKKWFGCESRQFVWAKSEPFIDRFAELFNFATITHYVWDSWYELFEPREGRYNWGIKDDAVQWLAEHDITIEGRPLFWFHPTVTPDWLKNKSFSELKKYIERHTHDLITHYGDKVLQWEVVNEYHDWANIHNHSPEQITEIVRLACDKTRETNPKVVRILNNCCPWAEYAAHGRMARMDATRPLRSPRKFLRDLHEAGVEYEVLGIQIYFPQRDLSDIVRLLERLSALGKPIYITETGASSNLMTQSGTGAVTASPGEPYAWHRHWDEELQADWLEQMYTICYSKPYIKAVNWYDFSDFRPFIANGGLIREDSTPKQSFYRLKTLLNRLNNSNGGK